MITIITYVSTEQGFENLKRSTVNLEEDYDLGLNILCIVGDKDLYLRCRDWLQDNIDRAGVLTVFYEGNYPLEWAKENLTFNDPFVYLANQNLIIPSGGISALYKDFIEQPTAGFISGFFVEYPTVYWVDDIYDAWSKRYRWGEKQVNNNNLVEVDTTLPTGMLTKSLVYRDLFCRTQLDEYGNLSYGIRLRRQGYRNYLDTNIKLKYGDTTQ